MTEYIHSPVMIDEISEYLAPRGRNETMVDGNLGEGGHSYHFLSTFKDLRIIGIEADSEIMAIAKERLKEFSGRMNFYQGWSHDFFAEYPEEYNRPDTILFDFGVSLYHYKKSGRGFSFANNEILDMRIDTSFGSTAADIIAKSPEKELADILFYNAGEKYSRRIASLIVKERQKSSISTAQTLSGLVYRAVPASYRHGHIHPATRTFMALRIAVNGELLKLPELLEASFRVLAPGGRLGALSFHSAEDRIVKNFFKEKNKGSICTQETPKFKSEGFRSINILAKKGIEPSKDEIERNPPSRSARFRVAEKINDGVIT